MVSRTTVNARSFSGGSDWHCRLCISIWTALRAGFFLHTVTPPTLVHPLPTLLSQFPYARRCVGSASRIGPGLPAFDSGGDSRGLSRESHHLREAKYFPGPCFRGSHHFNKSMSKARRSWRTPQTVCCCDLLSRGYRDTYDASWGCARPLLSTFFAYRYNARRRFMISSTAINICRTTGFRSLVVALFRQAGPYSRDGPRVHDLIRARRALYVSRLF